MLRNALERCLQSARKKNWDTIYIAVDIHDTIVKGNYNTDELPTEWLSDAKEALQYLSQRKDIVLLLYTCSHPAEIEKYFKFFESNGITFKYANENPDVPNNALGCYTNKMYFNILLEDKAGFDPAEWRDIMEFFKANPSILQTTKQAA